MQLLQEPPKSVFRSIGLNCHSRSIWASIRAGGSHVDPQTKSPRRAWHHLAPALVACGAQASYDGAVRSIWRESRIGTTDSTVTLLN